MTTIHTLGYPRIGAQRELKFALERHWRGEIDAAALEAVAAALRERHWALQRDAGLDLVTVGDFAFYVTRAARGRGAGKTVLAALAAECEARGFWKLVSRIFPENDASRAADERVFTQAGQIAGQNSEGAGLAATSADDRNEFFDTLAGLALAAGELG